MLCLSCHLCGVRFGFNMSWYYVWICLTVPQMQRGRAGNILKLFSILSCTGTWDIAAILKVTHDYCHRSAGLLWWECGDTWYPVKKNNVTVTFVAFKHVIIGTGKVSQSILLLLHVLFHKLQVLNMQASKICNQYIYPFSLLVSSPRFSRPARKIKFMSMICRFSCLTWK